MSFVLLAYSNTKASRRIIHSTRNVLIQKNNVSKQSAVSFSSFDGGGGGGRGPGGGGGRGGKGGERGEGAFDRFLERRGGSQAKGDNNSQRRAGQQQQHSKGKEASYIRPTNDNTRTMRVSGMGNDHYKPQKGIRKQNVAKQMFDPAFEGKLQKKHSDGIPKLLGRKGKSMTAVHDATPGAFMNELEDDVLQGQKEEEIAFPYENDEFREGGFSFTSSPAQLNSKQQPSVGKMGSGRSPAHQQSNKVNQTIVKDGKKYTYNPNHFPDIFSFYTDEEPTYTVADEQKSNAVLPLPSHGSTVDDFVAADMSNPSKYSYIYRPNVHIESRREPKPLYHHRANPSKDFVDQYKSYLYVDGLQLPPSLSFKKDGSNNELLLQHYAKVLAENVGRLFLASKQSVFVGVTDNNLAKRTLKRLHRMAVTTPISISIYQHTTENDSNKEEEQEEAAADDNNKEENSKNKELEEFISATTDTKSIIQITGIQLNKQTPQELLQLYFPAETYHSKLYENMTAEDLFPLPSTSTLLARLSTPKHATTMITSQSYTARITKLNERMLQVFPASREKVLDTFQGVSCDEPVYKKGNKLVVLGDIPLKKEFYTSHEAVVRISNLPLDISKEELTRLLKPFCEMSRDIHGSIQFITCPYGHPTGRAFIGFDLPGEAELFLSSPFTIENQRITKQMLHDKPLYKKMTKHALKSGKHLFIKGKRLPYRPNRNEDDILDSLHNWEVHVNKDKLQDLIDYGIDKDHLDSIFISARYKNRSFGVYDLARQNEKLETDRATGSRYKNFVKTYVDILWQILPWKDSPGDAIRAMFMEGQKLDYAGKGYKLFESKIGSVGPKRVQIARKRRAEREIAKSKAKA